MIYTLTTMHEDGRQPRCWGWFRTQAEAEACILSSGEWFSEGGYYNVAVIEEAPPGIVTICNNRWWYSIDDADVRKIPEPHWARRVVNFGIG